MFSPMQMVMSLLALVVLCSAATAGSIRYPAPGNVELQEGTIEMWLTPTADLYPPMRPGGYQNVLSLVTWQVQGEFSLGARWIARGGKDEADYRLHVSISHKQDDTALRSVPGTAAGWKQGSEHHFAFTWSGREMRLYADGVLIKHVTQTRGFSGQLAGSELIFGDVRGRDAGYVLRAIRVSRVARDETSLKHAKPEADVATLLLDRFDADAQLNDTTKAQVINQTRKLPTLTRDARPACPLVWTLPARHARERTPLSKVLPPRT